jgi:hypothetical protein
LGSFFLFFRGEGQALASSNSTKTKSEKLRKGTRREEKKREPKGDINKRQILPAVKTFYFWLSKLVNLQAKNDLNGNPETSEHFSEMRRAEEKISLISGSSLSVTSSLSNEANTNLIAHNNDRLPLRTSSLNEETNTNLIAHNNSGLIFSLSCCL